MPLALFRLALKHATPRQYRFERDVALPMSGFTLKSFTCLTSLDVDTEPVILGVNFLQLISVQPDGILNSCHMFPR